MNKLLVIFLLISLPCFAEDFVRYDVNNLNPVYLQSIDPTQAGVNSYYVQPVNHDNVKALFSIGSKYLKKGADGMPVEMTQEEKNAVDQQEAQVIHNAMIAQVDGLDVTVKDVFTAFIKVYNSKVPAQYRITKQELIDQLRLDLNL